MLGPVGTVGAGGGVPRLGDTKPQSSDAPSPTHSHGVPSDALSCARRDRFRLSRRGVAEPQLDAVVARDA